jgi:hypothetical protein
MYMLGTVVYRAKQTTDEEGEGLLLDLMAGIRPDAALMDRSLTCVPHNYF